MRVQFAPCGLGLGHAGRCVPLARKLEDQEGHQILFSTYLEGLKLVRQEGFPAVEVDPLGFVVKPDGTVDFRQTTVNPGPFLASFTFLKQVNTEIRIMKAFKPDVVVSDSRVSSVVAAKMLGIPELCILNQFQIIIPRRKRFLRLARLADAFTLTTIGKVWTSGVYTLIPDFPPPYTLSTGNLRIPESYSKCVKLIGPILPFRHNDLPSQRDLLTKLELERDKPLIFAPISGPVKERAYFTGILRKVFKEFPDDYQIVMSLGYPNTSSKPVRDKNVVIYGWTPNRFEYLKACDLVVAKAGHGTLTQAICYGKPMILVPTPNHTEQLNNAVKAVKLGVAEMLPQPNVSKQRLLRETRKILEDGRYQETVERIQKDVAKLNGVETAVQMIKDAAETRGHREATIS